jgi:hypothetical protein
MSLSVMSDNISASGIGRSRDWHGSRFPIAGEDRLEALSYSISVHPPCSRPSQQVSDSILCGFCAFCALLRQKISRVLCLSRLKSLRTGWKFFALCAFFLSTEVPQCGT